MSLNALILMRHAKSDWRFDDLDDHSRPLNGRGQRDAPLIGCTLLAKGVVPDLIWSSDSQRTRETAAGLCSGLAPDLQPETVYMGRFYHASANAVVTACAAKGEPAAKTLMLLGHNPGWEDLAQYFSGDYMRMPTAACVIFKRRIGDDGGDDGGDDDWLSAAAWQLQDYICPKDLVD